MGGGYLFCMSVHMREEKKSCVQGLFTCMPKNPHKQKELWSITPLSYEQLCVSQRSLGTAALKKTKLIKKKKKIQELSSISSTP